VPTSARLGDRPGRRLVGRASSPARLPPGGESAPQCGPGLYGLRRAVSLTGHSRPNKSASAIRSSDARCTCSQPAWADVRSRSRTTVKASYVLSRRRCPTTQVAGGAGATPCPSPSAAPRPGNRPDHRRGVRRAQRAKSAGLTENHLVELLTPPNRPAAGRGPPNAGPLRAYCAQR
jgi:hypothetical protein